MLNHFRGDDGVEWFFPESCKQLIVGLQYFKSSSGIVFPSDLNSLLAEIDANRLPSLLEKLTDKMTVAASDIQQAAG